MNSIQSIIDNSTSFVTLSASSTGERRVFTGPEASFSVEACVLAQFPHFSFPTQYVWCMCHAPRLRPLELLSLCILTRLNLLNHLLACNFSTVLMMFEDDILLLLRLHAC